MYWCRGWAEVGRAPQFGEGEGGGRGGGAETVRVQHVLCNLQQTYCPVLFLGYDSTNNACGRRVAAVLCVHE